MRALRLIYAFLVLLLIFPPSGPAWAQAKRRKPKPVPTAPKAPLNVLSHADSLVLKARGLIEARKEAEALALCREALLSNPGHYEALWRASVLCSRVGARYTDETRQQQYYDEARGHAAWALEIHPTFATANYAMALAIASEGTLLPLRGRLAARIEEKPYIDATLRDDPEHADAWQLLARWYFKTANYTVFETLASKLLLGRIPHGSTNALALASIWQAIDINPKRIDYYYDLARMHLLKGRRRAALQVLVEGTQNAELVTNEDLAVSRQMELLLQHLERRRKLRAPELEPR